MKKKKMLDQMAAVTHAQYLREHARVKPVLDEEARRLHHAPRLLVNP